MRVASRRRRQTPPRRRPRRQPPPRPRSQQPARGGRPEQRGENRIRSRTDPMPPTLTSVGRSHFRFEYFFWRRDLAFFSRGGRSDTNIHIQSGFGSTFVAVSTISGFLAGMAATGSAGYIYTRRARGVMGEDNRYSFFLILLFPPGRSTAPSAEAIVAEETVLGPLAVPASSPASPLPTPPVGTRLPHTELAIEEQEEEFKSCRH